VTNLSIIIRSDSISKQEQSGKAEVEDGEIEDAKMTDVGTGKVGEAKPTRTPSQAGSTTPSVVTGDTGQDATSGEQPRVRSRPTSRAPTSSRQPDIPKRPDIRQQVHPPVRPPPRHSDGRLPPRPEGLDDRRERHPDFGPRGRHGGPDHNRSFDGSLGDVRGRLNEHLNDRDRDFPIRPPPDDLMRGPPRDARSTRENGWPMDRPGRMRGPGPNDSFHGRDPSGRGELLPDPIDRPVDIPRRGDPSRPERPEKDDRRPYPPRPLSPPRPADLPNRPDRFPPPDDRRSGGFPSSSRIDDLPRAPRTDRQADHRDTAPGPDMTHGRLRQPEPPSEIPAGPRRRGGRNIPGQAPPMLSSSNATLPTPERQTPTGPARQSGRGAPEQPAVPTQPVGSSSAPGVHPDRLRNLVNEPAAPAAAPSGPRGLGPQQPPRGPSAQSGQSGPPGQGFGGERGRGDKRFAGLNNMLQQSGGGGGDRGGNPPPVRGRGANRPSSNMEAPSPQPANRPPMGPAGPQEDLPRNRPNGGRGGDLIDDIVPDTGRSGPTGNRSREMEPTREKEAERRDGSSSGRNRRDGRRNDRERSRRSDVGSGGGRDEKGAGEPRETLRRVQSSREEMRRRDRRDRPDGPSEMSGPAPSSSEPHEAEGRLRPPSSMDAPPPPPPPPPPPMPDGNERRFNSGDRGSRSDNRDRERERRGDRRDRDHQREGGSGSGGSGHRKRGRQGPDDGPDGGRGMRMGNDNKRPRRGA
jgi:THO complex subunit 2